MPSLPRRLDYTPYAAGATLDQSGSEVRCWSLNVPGATPSGQLTWTLPVNRPIQILDVVVRKIGAGSAGDAVRLTWGGGVFAITDSLSLAVAAGALVRAGSITNAFSEVAASGTLELTVTNGGFDTVDCLVDIYWTQT